MAINNLLENNTYKLVIFDLDDCLIDTWGASFPVTIEKAIRAMIDKGLGIESFEGAVNRLNKINSQSENCSGAITRYLEEIGENIETYLEIGKRAIYDFNFDDRIKPLPNALETITILEKRGINLAIVTKGEEEIQMKKLYASGINPVKFKRIMAVTNYDKTESYKTILNELGYSPGEVLVVGDRYKTDLIPARNLGIKTAWIPWGRGKINPPTKGEVDYKLDNLKEIIKLV